MQMIIINGTTLYFSIDWVDGHQIFTLFNQLGEPLCASEVYAVDTSQ